MPLFNPKLGKRFHVVVAHRRSGKTVAALQWLISKAVRKAPLSARYAYIAPLRNQAKNVAWDYLKGFVSAIPETSINESELRVDLAHGARIQLYGSDNPDALRGGYLDGCVLDEVAQMSPDTWTHVVRPMLADRKGKAVFIGTPAGKNYFFDLFEQAERLDGWSRLFLPASQTKLIDEDELNAARGAMTPEAFAQEFELSWTAAIRGAYYGEVMERIERAGHMLPLDIDPASRLITAWDLGTRDATAIWVIQPYRGNSWAMLDYYESSGAGVDHYAQWLDANGYLRGSLHLAPHDIANTDWSSAGGLNRKAVAEQHGIVFERTARPQNSSEVMEQINAVRLTLDRCYFHHDTDARGSRVYSGRLSLSLYRQGWNEKLGALKAAPIHDAHSHCADALRTFVSVTEGLRRENPGRTSSPDRINIKRPSAKRQRAVNGYRRGS